MRVIIAGSRTIRSAQAIEDAMIHSLFTPTVVLSGGQRSWDEIKRCWYGADYFGELWAQVRGIPLERFEAKWKRYGGIAGPIRNETMVLRAQALVAIWDGFSPGTADIVRRAEEVGLRVFEWRT